MTLETSEIRVLSAFFSLAQQDRAATVIRLGAEADLPREALLPCLERLHAGGYVDREQLRLTLSGLALAVAFGARSRVAEARTLAA